MQHSFLYDFLGFVYVWSSCSPCCLWETKTTVEGTNYCYWWKWSSMFQIIFFLSPVAKIWDFPFTYNFTLSFLELSHFRWQKKQTFFSLSLSLSRYISCISVLLLNIMYCKRWIFLNVFSVSLELYVETSSIILLSNKFFLNDCFLEEYLIINFEFQNSFLSIFH